MEADNTISNLNDNNVMDISQNENTKDLHKARDYEKIKECNGLSIYEASKKTGIAYSTLALEIKEWEFLGLIKTKIIFRNNRALKIIETIGGLDNAIK